MMHRNLGYHVEEIFNMDSVKTATMGNDKYFFLGEKK
jgi:hypothetical protein